mmetsp:Transcript_38321/g.44661  ORF Transcript_38321/g.44661 Transcript_38321/m.44661 type:complete len:100 (-) Transcript_38321:200-499(-)
MIFVKVKAVECERNVEKKKSEFHNKEIFRCNSIHQRLKEDATHPSFLLNTREDNHITYIVSLVDLILALVILCKSNERGKLCFAHVLLDITNDGFLCKK